MTPIEVTVREGEGIDKEGLLAYLDRQLESLKQLGEAVKEHATLQGTYLQAIYKLEGDLMEAVGRTIEPIQSIRNEREIPAGTDRATALKEAGDRDSFEVVVQGGEGIDSEQLSDYLSLQLESLKHLGGAVKEHATLLETHLRAIQKIEAELMDVVRKAFEPIESVRDRLGLPLDELENERVH